MKIDLTHILTLLTGGVLWEAFKFFYPEVKNYFNQRKEARLILYNNLDLAIKSADELYGKIDSLAKEDFATFINTKHSNSNDPEHSQLFICYLFAQFWASLERIRHFSNYTSIARLKKGEKLLQFIQTIESRKFRLLDRSKQRIIAEGMLSFTGETFKILPLKSFLEILNNDEAFSKWIYELKDCLLNSRKIAIRQRVLVFGVIAAMFLDHFDKKHKVGRRRDIYKNKLRTESKKTIKHVLIKNYLPFIKKWNRYY